MDFFNSLNGRGLGAPHQIQSANHDIRIADLAATEANAHPPLDKTLLERVRAGDATAAGLIENEVKQRIRRGPDRIPLDQITIGQYLAAFNDGIKQNPEFREGFNNAAREVYLYNDDPKATLEALWENRNLPIVHELLQNLTETKPICKRSG